MIKLKEIFVCFDNTNSVKFVHEVVAMLLFSRINTGSKHMTAFIKKSLFHILLLHLMLHK